jgi:hypothetical protein
MTAVRPRYVLLALLALAAAFIGVRTDSEAQTVPTISLPANAAEVAPGVFALGLSRVDGVVVEGFVFVRTLEPSAGQAHAAKGGIPGPPDRGGVEDPPAGGGDVASCYSFICGSSIGWQTPESFTVNPTAAPNGWDAAKVGADVETAIDKWETAAALPQMMGGYVGMSTAAAPDSSDENAVFFGDFEQAGVIAATYVWRTVGPPQTRQIVAWDMIVDVVDFAWSDSENGTPGTMDFLNILTHEIGHAVGMGHTDAPTGTDADLCWEQTMYPSAGYAETQKRDLGDGDIAGINVLY